MNGSAPKPRVEFSLALLAISLFLAPLIGGQVSLDSLPTASGFLDAILGGPETPLLTHALLTIPVAAAFILLMRRQVVQVPNAILTTTLFLFFGLLMATVMISKFRLTSLATASEWLAYALVFLTAAGAVGRRTGPVVVFTAVFAGCVLMAMRGLMEYGEMKAIDPTWRIFAGWINPNATAAMLLVGFFLGLSLLALSKERIGTLLCGLGVALIGLGIALTQSKGALLVLLGALTVYGIAILSLGRGAERKQALLRCGGAVVAVVLLAALVQVRATPAATSGGTAGLAQGGLPLGRIAQVQSTSEQSAGFRTLLWKGALNMVRKNPVGYGIGTYRFESGRSGLHTQTVFTHSAFLQLATEGSVVLPFLLGVSGGIWIWLAFRGWKTLPPERRILQAGIFAALTAIFAHSWLDSDLYYFGVGLSFFALLGVGLLLSADAVAPEFAPKPVRAVGMAGSVFVVGVLLFVGLAESMRAQARGQIAARDQQGASATLASLRGFAPFDGEGWYLSGQVAPTDVERLVAVERAVEFAPTTRNLRLLARLYADQSQPAKAVVNLRAALTRDPNNLPALNQLADLYDKQGNPDEAIRTRERLVAVEQSSYFQIRSLPELIPTETFEARIKLAGPMTGLPKIAMLEPAIEGFRTYLAKTVPMIKQMAAATPPSDYGGEDPAKAQQKLAIAAEAARRAAATYRALGDTAGAAAADGAAVAFGAAFDK